MSGSEKKKIKAWNNFDFDRLMTCPFKIHNQTREHGASLFIVEPVMIEVASAAAIATGEEEDIQFFKAYSLEEAQHIVKREWFKKIYAELTKF